MLTRDMVKGRGQVEIVEIEELVPKEHLLKKIDAAIDFTPIYGMVEELYSGENDRPSIDPVVLVKMTLIQHLYGLPSLRRTASEVNMNIAYRWFLRYGLREETPHFSTIRYNFRHRFAKDTADRIFVWILNEIADAGYLTPSAVFINGTHIKASANNNKEIKQEIPKAAKRYTEELMKEVNEDREAHGKKPFDDDDGTPPTKPTGPSKNASKKKLARRKKAEKEAKRKKAVTKSTTDPDCGMFVKGDHKRQFAYEAHTACDKNGYVLATVVTAGNVHDSIAFDDVYNEVT